MTATTTGLTAEAAAKADERIKGMVDGVVSAAVADDDGECMEGETKCGYFEQTLTVLPCAGEFICLKQHVNGVPVGSAVSSQIVDVLVLDPATGRAVDLSSFVPRKATKKFLAAVNAEVASVQEQAGFYDPTYPPELTQEDFSGWAPLADRIQIWFSRYVAGPGAMGAVTVAVPYPKDMPAATDASTQSTNIVSTWEDLYAYYCPRDPEQMPTLVDDNADSYATSILQVLLRSWQYDVGPINGQYGPTTQRAVREYQRDMGLAVDGLVGPQTWRALRNVCESEGGGTTASEDQPSTAAPSVVLVTVPDVVGMRNKDAERLLMGLGLGVLIQAQVGDPSIAAQVVNDCVVTSQQVAPGAQVERGTTIWARMQCPNTGYNTP